MVEKIFRQSTEFCSEHETWRLNVAHVFFMQETKFKDAIKYYEPHVGKMMEQEQILECQAIVLANLCVSYIMTSQNEKSRWVMLTVLGLVNFLYIFENTASSVYFCLIKPHSRRAPQSLKR